MGLSFRRGHPDAPKGHTLLYFQDNSDSRKVYATYVVVLPVAVDFVKYMPPFLSSQLGGVSPDDLSAFAFPPVPEPFAELPILDALAATRDDDLLFGGTVDATHIPDLLPTVAELVQEYAQIYSAFIVTQQSPPGTDIQQESPELDVNSVLYELLGERDRIAELTKLIGKLHFAANGQDSKLSREVEEEIHVLARLLPENYHIQRLLEAAQTQASHGSELAQLYLERCYKLASQEFEAVPKLDEQIRRLEEQRREASP